MHQVGHGSTHSQAHYSYLLQHWSEHQDAAALQAGGNTGGVSHWCILSSLETLWALFVFVVILWQGLLFALEFASRDYHRRGFSDPNRWRLVLKRKEKKCCWQETRCVAKWNHDYYPVNTCSICQHTFIHCEWNVCVRNKIISCLCDAKRRLCYQS